MVVDWTQLTVAVAALLVLLYVVQWNAKQQEKRDDRQAKRYEELFEKYAGLTASVLDVVDKNTEALTRVDEDLKGRKEGK